MHKCRPAAACSAIPIYLKAYSTIPIYLKAYSTPVNHSAAFDADTVEVEGGVKCYTPGLQITERVVFHFLIGVLSSIGKVYWMDTAVNQSVVFNTDRVRRRCKCYISGLQIAERVVSQFPIGVQQSCFGHSSQDKTALGTCKSAGLTPEPP